MYKVLPMFERLVIDGWLIMVAVTFLSAMIGYSLNISAKKEKFSFGEVFVTLIASLDWPMVWLSIIARANQSSG